MINPLFQGIPLIPSRAAMNEMFDFGINIESIMDILENGYDCAKSKRSKDTIERCIDKKKKAIRVVAVHSYNYSLETDVWVITHIGITSKPEMRK